MDAAQQSPPQHDVDVLFTFETLRVLNKIDLVVIGSWASSNAMLLKGLGFIKSITSSFTSRFKRYSSPANDFKQIKSLSSSSRNFR